ncbi:MAG: polymer-forming cytoskeletal protein [Bacteroidales bacterium]|nr:polymer-forming cytoskeletal protein [Bacteroidales bacterium]
MANRIDAPSDPVRNQIGTGTLIKGNIESGGDIRFDGNLVGNIRTKGKVVIGSTGEIKGEVFCNSSIIEGKIEGKIIVDELLTLNSTAVIIGDIVAKKLAIEPGARFTGTCNMSSGYEQPKETTKPEDKKP